MPMTCTKCGQPIKFEAGEYHRTPKGFHHFKCPIPQPTAEEQRAQEVVEAMAAKIREHESTTISELRQRAEIAEHALDILQRRIDTLIGVTCKRCEAGDKLFVEPDTGFYTHTLGGNYCSAHKLHSLLNTPQSQIARALKS